MEKENEDSNSNPQSFIDDSRHHRRSGSSVAGSLRWQVVGVDMNPSMLERAKHTAEEAGIENVDFRQGYGEELPVDEGWADVVISNGVLNLMPDKSAGLKEMARVLNPTGRLQIADILVQEAVPDSGKTQIDLWTG